MSFVRAPLRGFELRCRKLKGALPGKSAPTIRLVLNELRDEGLVRTEGKGAGAAWIRNEPNEGLPPLAESEEDLPAGPVAQGPLEA